MPLTLAVIAGPHKGRAFTFSGHDTFLVGRSVRAHFQLRSKDKYFSRLHFMVEVNPPRCRVMDFGSRNGTFVNGQRISVAEVKNGDLIKAGHTILRVGLVDSEAVTVEVVAGQTGSSSSATVADSPALAPGPPRLAPAAAPPPVPGVPLPTSCPICAAALPEPQAAVLGLCPACAECSRQLAQTIPGFVLVRELGRGGMGVVYLALRAADLTPVALKTISPAVAGTPKQFERFLREANILQQLRHPNIVSFQEMGESYGLLYFAMDYVQGTNAEDLLQRHGPLPIHRAVPWICQLLEALGYAHARKFVHRDIKPANMLVTAEAGGEVVRLADFGLARVYQASQLSGLTLAGEIGGTVAFMAPEQITNYRDAKPAVDQYSAAATLYYLITGKYLFDFPDLFQERLIVVLMESPVPIRSRNPAIPGELAAVIDRAVAKEPEARFADVGALRAALLPYCG
jgi:serine/threonine-protein kinase